MLLALVEVAKQQNERQKQLDDLKAALHQDLSANSQAQMATHVIDNKNDDDDDDNDHEQVESKVAPSLGDVQQPQQHRALDSDNTEQPSPSRASAAADVEEGMKQ